MRIKRILGIISIICGIVLFALSGYIANQVAIGRGEISRGQAKVSAGQTKVNNAQKEVNSAQTGVNVGNQVIDNATRVKGLGGLVTSPVQGKINSGQEQINAGQEQINAGKKKIKEGILKANSYDKLASNLKIGGVVLVIIGALLLLLSFKKGKWFNRQS